MLGFLAFLSACGGKAGDVVRPKDITGAAALGKAAAKCTGEPKLASPLVVDLDSSSRVDLEAAMKQGVVVVAYDCASLRVLSACKVSGGEYAYTGVSRKEDVVQMKNQDEAAVNLPFSGGKAGGEIKSGNSIDLALVYIGQHATTVGRIDRAEMSGGCEEATHFLRSANVGAFSMATGSAGKVTAVAELFKIGASGLSSATRNVTTTDGSLEACRSSNPDAPAPPAECRSAISVQLMPLAGSTARKVEKHAPSTGDLPEPAEPKTEKAERAKEAKPEIAACPPGFVRANGICTNAAEASHLCKPDDDDDCKAQCEKGSAESCYNYANGKKIAAKDRLPFYTKACEGGVAEGCGDEAFERWDVENANNPANKDALELAKKGCGMGGAKACDVLGDFLGRWAEKGKYSNPAESLKAYDRGCSLGNGASCASAARALLAEAGVRKNEPKAIEYLERACYGDNNYACDTLMVHLLLKADAGNRDPDRAFRVAQYGCRVAESNCANGLRVAMLVNKPAEAVAMARSGCERGQITCEELGDLYSTGRGTTKDPVKATEFWKKACESDRAADQTAASNACDKAAGKPGRKIGEKLAERQVEAGIEPAAKLNDKPMPAARPKPKPKKK
ncbi:MAG: sel1 repeat family protein [Polyangiaceae bacterium]|nr:sel1 repeat family protein [Polyangiaceae bacterium]